MKQLDTNPTIHMNGSNPQTLIHDLDQLATHLRAADVRLGNLTPQMRDFYVKEGGGSREFEAARQAHTRRRRAIHLVLEEIEAMHIVIVDQMLDKPGASAKKESEA